MPSSQRVLLATALVAALLVFATGTARSQSLTATVAQASPSPQASAAAGLDQLNARPTGSATSGDYQDVAKTPLETSR